MNMVNCKICHKENLKGSHYCFSCGNNISSQVELTDVLFFLSNFLKIFSIFLFFCIISLFFVANIIYSLSIGEKEVNIFIFLKLIIPWLLSVVFSYIIKKLGIKKCKENLQKIDK